MVVTFKVRLRRKTEKPELHVECSEGLERAQTSGLLDRSQSPLSGSENPCPMNTADTEPCPIGCLLQCGFPKADVARRRRFSLMLDTLIVFSRHHHDGGHSRERQNLH